MVALIILLAIAAVGLGAWAASTSLELRVGTRRSMRAIDDYATVNVRDQQMLESVTDRIVAPAGRRILDFAHGITPVGYGQNIKRKLVLAGSPPGYTFDRFMIWKVLGFASVALWAVLGFILFDAFLFRVAFVGVAWAVCFFGPDVALDRRVESRQAHIARSLPDTLDLLVISVEAGLGFEQALDRTAETVPGPLSEELRRMLQEVRMGASRADALRAIEERTQVEDLSTFIVAMLQADSFGVSIAKILHSQAAEIRQRRRQLVQERAQKLPVKMLAPLALCIFPVTLLVTAGPGLIKIYETLG